MHRTLFAWISCASVALAAPIWAQSDPQKITELQAPSDNGQGATQLSLSVAIEKALARSPRLKSASAAVLASQGTRTQAGLWPNPEISLMSENIAGSGLYRGAGAAETTLGLSQRLEIGGKRKNREAVAGQGMSISQFEQQAERQGVIRDTSVAYANAAAAQEALKLAAEQKDIAEDLFAEVRRRVGAAREPLLQQSKAEIAVSTANFAYERAGRELEHAKHVLSSQWGGHDVSFTLDDRDFFRLIPPPTEVEVEARLEESPELRRLQAAKSLSKAQYKLEKANAVPDPLISASVRDFQASDDQAFVIGLSFPLPVANRNQGNIERARSEVVKSDSDVQARRLALRNTLFESLESMINAYQSVENFNSSILPAAEKAYTLSRQAYGAGKFPYLEVLDAQRTLFTVKEQRIEALRNYHNAKADVERLTAVSGNRQTITKRKENSRE